MPKSGKDAKVSQIAPSVIATLNGTIKTITVPRAAGKKIKVLLVKVGKEGSLFDFLKRNSISCSMNITKKNISEKITLNMKVEMHMNTTILAISEVNTEKSNT